MTPLRTLLAAGAAFAALAAAPAAVAEPAMWIVKDQDSEIRLFGSVHLLEPSTVWRTPAFDAAFAAADEVWFEMDLSPASQQAAGALVGQLGLSPNRPLSAVLSAEDRAKVKAAAERLGVPDAQIEPMRPWLAGLTLTLVQISRSGFDPASGVERRLLAEVGDRPTKSFETAEQQFRFFADQSEAVQREFLMNAVADLDRGPEVLRRMIAEWVEGDVVALEELFLAEMRTNYAALYDVLIKKRNEAWAERIVAELEGSGTDFIAVGAGHLVGPDGVPALLAARGVSVERVGAAQPAPRRRGRR